MSNIELLIGQSSTEAERKRAARLQNKALSALRTSGGHLSDIRPPVSYTHLFSRCFRLRFAALIRFMRVAHSGQYLALLEPGVNLSLIHI